jgi:hypothetical protein
MPQISLTDFKATQEAAERRQRLAAALREQATSPIQIQSYNGIQAPIPVTEVLVKALQGYMAGRNEKKAEKDLAEGRATARREAMDFVRGLKQETPQDRFIAPPNFQPEQPGIIDRLKQAGQQFMPQQPQPMSAPQGPPPQMPPPAGAPMVPAQPMAMPQGSEAMSLDASQLRQIPAELQNRARSPEEQQQMLMDAAMSGNPYLESIAPSMYEGIEKQETARNQRARQAQTIMSLDLPDAQKAMLMAEVELGDSDLLKQFTKPDVPIQAPAGVEGLVLQKYSNGEPLNPQEQRILDNYFAVQKRRSYIAPRGGGGGGGPKAAGGGADPVEAELRRRGLL